MNAYQIAEIDNRVRLKFTYVRDEYDMWTSYADEILRGENIKGDCDDLASTVLDIMAREGADPAKMYRAQVSTTKTGPVDHMVGMITDDLGRLWIVGDTFKSAYRANRMSHRLVKTAKLSEGLGWRKAKLV